MFDSVIVVARVEGDIIIEIVLGAKAETDGITQGLEDEDKVLKERANTNVTVVVVMVIWLDGVEPNQRQKNLQSKFFRQHFLFAHTTLNI